MGCVWVAPGRSPRKRLFGFEGNCVYLQRVEEDTRRGAPRCEPGDPPRGRCPRDQGPPIRPTRGDPVPPSQGRPTRRPQGCRTRLTWGIPNGIGNFARDSLLVSRGEVDFSTFPHPFLLWYHGVKSRLPRFYPLLPWVLPVSPPVAQVGAVALVHAEQVAGDGVEADAVGRVFPVGHPRRDAEGPEEL